MNTKLNRGDKVKCNGYPGVVVREYSDNMYEVRLNSGLVCVDVSDVSLITCVWCKSTVNDAKNKTCCSPDGDGHLFN